jgi:hypothetical protein
MEFGSNFVDILLWTLWFFLFFAFISVLFRVIGDLYADPEAGGWSKFFWTMFIIFLPFLGLLIYLIVRGNGMADREVGRAKQMQAAQAAYIRQAAGTGASAADQIASAKALLDSGTITQAEFDALKAKALAS